MVSRRARNQVSENKREQKAAEPDPQVSPNKPVLETEATRVIPEVVEELSEDELKERHQLELKVERAFVEAGRALKLLRHKRLYRDRYKTFQEYCQVRFGYTRRSVDYLIAGSEVVDNLNESRGQDPEPVSEMRKILSQKILPTKLEQVRSLTHLEPEQQCQVWDEAVEAAGSRVPSGRIVKSIVDRLKEKPLPRMALR